MTINARKSFLYTLVLYLSTMGTACVGSVSTESVAKGQTTPANHIVENKSVVDHSQWEAL